MRRGSSGIGCSEVAPASGRNAKFLRKRTPDDGVRNATKPVAFFSFQTSPRFRRGNVSVTNPNSIREAIGGGFPKFRYTAFTVGADEIQPEIKKQK